MRLKPIPFIVAALVILVGAGAVLIHTRQASVEPARISELNEFETEGLEPLSPDGSEAVVQDVVVTQQSAPVPPAALAGKKLSVEEFRSLGMEVMKELPTKRAIQNEKATSNEASPLPVIDASKALEKISNAVKAEPSLEAEAVPLYRECASSSTFADSVRALCYSHYRALSQRLGKPLTDKGVPRFIRNMADQMAN